MKIPVERTLATTCAPRLVIRAVSALAPLLLLTVGAQAQHECVPYEPTEAGEVIDSTWGAQFEKDNYEFTVPADPGGGYVIARIETTAPSSPSMRIIPPSGLGVVAQAGPSLPGPSPQVLEVAFEVDAETTFQVEIFEAAVSSPGAFPVPYKWSWTFVSRVDCYEPNDGIPFDWPGPAATSKTVPIDQIQEAYSLAGYLDFGIAAFDAHNFDWYDFTLTDPTEVWLATLTTPLDQSIRVRLFGNDGLTIVDQVPETGETGLIGPTMLQPGTYYLDLHSEIRGESSVTLSEGGTIPDHFDRPYHFIVSTIDPTFASLNGASFVAEHGLASDSWVSLFGGRIMATLLVDSTLPETLEGFTVEITDSAGVTHNARIYVVANGQLNILMPPGMAAGPATLKVWNNEQLVAVETIQIAAVSPGIFSAASNGMGVAAAVFQLAGPGDPRTDGLTFDANLAPVPLDFGPAGAELYVSLFGTGLRNFSGEVTVTVDGMPVPFSGPVAQGEFDGLDQLNIGPLPRSLAGRGEVEIVVTVDGKQANVVTVAFQ
jgi:uncharacterized protein (TIGR03437 family)